jgi:hypothetical protein
MSACSFVLINSGHKAIGHGLRAKRSKSGAVSFELMEMEPDHAPFQ